MTHLNRFIRAKNLDKRMVMDYLQGQDPRRKYPFYHAPLVPTCAPAVTPMAGAFLYPLRRRIMSNPTIYDQATKAVVKMLETAGTDWQKPLIHQAYGVHSSSERI
ncbi:MAG: hypothetical protein VCF25_05680 [Candidatus Poribacteria bacterium]|jgi:hypothetical protein